MLAAVLTAALAAVSSAHAAGVTSVRLVACEPAGAGGGGAATFEGRMRAQRPGQRLQMRFTLQVAAPGAPRFRPVAAAGLGVWHTAAPGVTRWTYDKRVEDLVAPARYRARVRFRWRDADGRVVAHDTATSAVCRQEDTRPDLRMLRVTADPAGPATAGYHVPVRNAGGGPAGATSLALTVAGSALAPVPVPPLAPGAETVVTVTGPRCPPGAQLGLVLDPAGRVDETTEQDNFRTVACPPGAAP